MKKLIIFFCILIEFIIPKISLAHEAYVLTPAQFKLGLSLTTQNPLAGLFDPQYLLVSAVVTLVLILSYGAVVLFSTTKLAQNLDKFIKKFSNFGPLIIRITISVALIYGSLNDSVLGPEISLTMVPYGVILRVVLLILGVMILFGFLTEVAGLFALLIFFYLVPIYDGYLFTYANYFGELVTLLLFGARFISIDYFLFGKDTIIRELNKLKYLETPIIRVCFGFALIYAAYTIKFLHQSLPILVYNEYGLSRYFHASASFVAAGAGMTELFIGVSILFGFVMRFTLIIFVIFITLSLLFFKEAVWPHYLLYGISFHLFLNSADKFTVDHYLPKLVRKYLKIRYN